MGATLLLVLFINIGILIPSSPGAFGIMQVAFISALIPFGVTQETAVALSLIYQAVLYLFTLTLGSFYLLTSQLSLSELVKKGSKATN